MYIIDQIRAQRPSAQHVTASLDEETWIAEIDGVTYVCEIGSDDERFEFVSDSGDVIKVELP